MGKSLWIVPILLLFTAIGAPPVLRASNITYTVNQPLPTGSIMGTITTDGKIGILLTTDIVAWSLTATDGTHPAVISSADAGSGEIILGTELAATLGVLQFNFAAMQSNGIWNIFDNGASVIWTTELPAAGFAGSIQYRRFDTCPNPPLCFFDALNESAGNPVIASVAVSPTPEPDTFTLMLIGIGLVLVMRNRTGHGLLQSR